MKRKLFTLLVAFVALVTFQANAQGGSDPWYYINTKAPTEPHGRPTPHTDGYHQNSGIPDNITFTTTLVGGVSYQKRLALPLGNWGRFPSLGIDASASGDAQMTKTPDGVLKKVANENFKSLTKSLGETEKATPLADYTRYFKLKKFPGTEQYTIVSADGSVLSFSVGGIKHDRFEFVEFADWGKLGVAKDPTIGGYLSVPSTNGTGGAVNRLFVVVNLKTDELSLMDHETMYNRNANIIHTATSTLDAYAILWAKAERVGGRWATPADFQDKDFVKFPFGNQNLYAYDNEKLQAAGNDAAQLAALEKYDVFRVSPVGAVRHRNVPGTNPANDGALFVGSNLKGDWGGAGAHGYTESAGLYKDPANNNEWTLPLFTIRAIGDNCKYLSVRAENKIQDPDESVRIVQGDLLELRGYGSYYDYATSKWINPVTPADPINTAFSDTKQAASLLGQAFAIWIDEEGKMSIYPAGAYEYDPTTHHKNVPESYLNENKALVHNTPYGNHDGADNGYAFKIGQYDITYTQHPDLCTSMKDLFCLTPVDYIAPTYLNGLFDCIDWTDKNVDVPEGRYFFIETKNITAFDKGRTSTDAAIQKEIATNGMAAVNGASTTYVLTVQSVLDDTRRTNTPDRADNYVKKIVLLPKEQLRTDPNGLTNENDYSTYAVDSVIMSAHWQVIKALDEDNKVIGYRLVNEMGDTLKYNGENNRWHGANPAEAEAIDRDSWTLLSNASVGVASNAGSWANDNGWRSLVPRYVIARGATNFDHNSFPFWVQGEPLAWGNSDWENGIDDRYSWTSRALQTPRNNPVADPFNHITNRTDSLDVWTAVKVKGSADGYFSLRLNTRDLGNGNKWQNSRVSLDTLSTFTYVNEKISKSDWYSDRRHNPSGSNYIALSGNSWSRRVASIKNAQVETYYWQRDVVARPVATGGYIEFGASCGGAMDFTFTPVTYENKDKSKTYTDASPNEDYYKNDSLTAYMYKEGFNNITEAVKLSKHIGSVNGVVTMGDYRTDDLLLEPVGTERSQLFNKAMVETTINGGTEYAYNPWGSTALHKHQFGTTGIGLISDALYNDTYKWHYIKKGNQYMVFDVINKNAATSDLMYGFTFKTVAKVNATPVRLYQPLVGDKINDNFIIQFIVPTYYYDVDNRGNLKHTHTVAATALGPKAEDFYDGMQTYAGHIGAQGGDDPRGYINSPGTDANIQPGAVRFAKFDRESGPIYITSDVKSKATRFTFSPQGGTCKQEFVTVDYLMDNGLYRLPVTAEVYEDHVQKDWFIAQNGVNGVEKQDISNAAPLRFLLADTLHPQTKSGNYDGGIGMGAVLSKIGKGVKKDDKSHPLGSSEGADKPFWNQESLAYFGYDDDAYNTTDKDVQLFYIQNEEGLYLTVIDKTIASQTLSNTTNADVYGGRLEFREQYHFTNKEYKEAKEQGKGVDKRPLQMFAIYGCPTSEAPFGEFVILPAASYQYDYSTKNALYDQPLPNTELGAFSSSGQAIATNAFRISYDTKASGSAISLMVVPGATDVNTLITAEEFKFTPQANYAGPFCHHNFVGSNGGGNKTINGKVTADWYYGADGVYVKDLTNPIMHWSINEVAGKKSLYTFAQELTSWRGKDVTNEQGELNDKGGYYIVEESGSDYAKAKSGKFEYFSRTNPKDVKRFSISCIDEAKYDLLCDDPKEDLLTKCHDKFYRFCDQTIVSTDFAIIEALANDRYIWDGLEEISDNNPKTEAAIAKKRESANPAECLEIIKSWVRPVSEHHSIPYYNIVRQINNKSYYLEVVFKANRPDSVRFREVSDLELDTLRNFDKNDAYRNALPGLKFCFPYRLDQLGDRMPVTSPRYRNADYHQVYVQTLDTGYQANMLKASVVSINHDSRTMIATQIRQNDILKEDYSDENKLDATAWFFGDEGGADYEWVKLSGVDTGSDTKGWLTSAGNDRPGSMYVTASGQSFNYGTLKALSQAGNAELTFEFEGDTIVGSYNAKPIWYYRIKNVDGQYLTNALPEGLGWHEGYPYAYFADIKTDNAPENAPITADKLFDQTFGLRHVPVNLQGGTEKGYFWVVSRVDYHDSHYGEYYYLCEKDMRLVFVKADLKDPQQVYDAALMFQLGTVDGGKYTDVENVSGGTLGAYGIDGAVKVVNAAGAIELYTVDGRKFNTVTATGSEQVIAAPRGVVIVKNGANVCKVVVK